MAFREVLQKYLIHTYLSTNQQRSSSLSYHQGKHYYSELIAKFYFLELLLLVSDFFEPVKMGFPLGGHGDGDLGGKSIQFPLSNWGPKHRG